MRGPVSMGLANALVTATSAMLVLSSQGWALSADTLTAIWPYIPGAFLGGATAALWAKRQHAWATAFASTAAIIALLTIATTAFIYAVQYKLFFAEGHAAAFTVPWFFQTFFTMAGSVYLFLSTGLALLVPWAVAGWLALAWWMARPAR